MNKTMTITVITLVAVIMGFGTIAPILPPAEARCSDCLVISNIGSSGEVIPHAKCTITYDKNGKTVSKTKFGNSKGESVFPLPGYVPGEPIVYQCVKPGFVTPDPQTAIASGDEIMVLLRPAPG